MKYKRMKKTTQFWYCPMLGQIVKTCSKGYKHGFSAFQILVARTESTSNFILLYFYRYIFHEYASPQTFFPHKRMIGHF